MDIVKIRKALGYNQTTVAKLCNTNTSTISKIEKKKIKDPNMLKRILIVLGKYNKNTTI